jgi:hypothetical protein
MLKLQTHNKIANIHVGTTSAARGEDNNGKNDEHSVAATALAGYPNLWHTNPYGSRGDKSAPLLGSSPGQYASLIHNLPAAGDMLYQGSMGTGDCLQDGHQAFSAAMSTKLQGLLCCATINIK